MTKDKVWNAIRHQMNLTALGMDGISSKVLKDKIKIIDVYIMRIVYMSITLKKFPNKWKIGNIIALYKNKDKSR